MTFKDENVEAFKELSKEIKPLIRVQKGCIYLEILQDISNPNIFFSYSHWQKEDNLEQYRRSDFFNDVWPKTKQWFAENPEAWSLTNTDI